MFTFHVPSMGIIGLFTIEKDLNQRENSLLLTLEDPQGLTFREKDREGKRNEKGGRQERLGVKKGEKRFIEGESTEIDLDR
jgi:hypothetical protein